MIIVLLLLILAIIFGVVFWKTEFHDLFLVPIASLSLCIVAICIAIVLFCEHLTVTIPPLKQAKYIYYEEQYNTLTHAINYDSNNIITLSGDIAEYNAEILKGRLMMDNFITSYVTYDFYYDLNLIELDSGNEEEK